MEELTSKRCVEGAPRLSAEALAQIAARLGRGWTVEGDRLRKEFRFPDFAQALAFVNRAGEVAEQENHHPDLHLSWGRVLVETWTHSAGGLTENDFVLAAKIEEAAG
ncbi:MAG TPA: 4a-hydroxytetrahydrobiopterin dehydratase [Kofleriaceae bacterium]|nr:4a-hydroxytetrahydrobiopterin dehydratase [Kofleriaceae bacterium]